MFFKRKMSTDEYCTTRLELLFSTEQTERWLAIKLSWPDQAIVAVDDELYLAHLRAAHIELLSIAVSKKYSVDIHLQMSKSIETYLDKHNHWTTKGFVDLGLYNRALGSYPPDGILAMAQFMMDCICQNRCSQVTTFAYRDLFYAALKSLRADFKEVKLVS